MMLLIFMLYKQTCGRQLAFSMGKVLQDKMHIQTLHVRGRGNKLIVRFVTNYPSKNWKLGTMKIAWKWFDMKRYQHSS